MIQSDLVKVDEVDLWVLLRTYKQIKKKECVRNEIARRYSPLAKKVARQVYKSHNTGIDLEYDDYASFAFIGLLDAITKFDYTKKVRFSTYARLRIYGAIIDEIRKLSFIPRTSLTKILRFKTYLQTDFDFNHTKKSERQLAKEFGLNDKEYALLHQPAFVSLDYKGTSLSEDADSQPNKSVQLKYSSNLITPDIHEQVEKQDNINKLNLLLESLPDKNRKIIIDLFFNKKTHADIARRYKITTAKVTQLINLSFKRMREYATENKLEIAL